MEDDASRISPKLLERIKAGDEEACDELVRVLYPSLLWKARRYIRQESDHEDVVQDILVKLFLKLDQYRGPKPFEHWAARIAVTTCYDWLRRRKARPLASFSDLSEAEARFLEENLRNEQGGVGAAQRELLDGLLDKLLTFLKPNEQIVIRMFDLEERSVREVAELTGWSPSKVKTLVMRARRKLSEQLRRLEGRSES